MLVIGWHLNYDSINISMVTVPFCESNASLEPKNKRENWMRCRFSLFLRWSLEQGITSRVRSHIADRYEVGGWGSGSLVRGKSTGYLCRTRNGAHGGIYEMHGIRNR